MDNGVDTEGGADAVGLQTGEHQPMRQQPNLDLWVTGALIYPAELGSPRKWI